MRRPITQKAKSPLKQTNPTMEKSETSTYLGEDIFSEVDNSEDPGKASGGRQTTDAEGYIAGLKKRFPNSTGQQLVDGGYISSAYADRFPSSFTEKKITPGEPITETKTNYFNPQTRDETTAITPWENRFNMRTSRQSERFARNEAKRDLRRNAKEAARDTRQDGGSFLEGRTARRDIMTGKSFQNDTQENLYNASRGLNADQNRVFSTDAQQSQFEQAATRGEKVLGTRRDMDMYDYGTATGATTVKTLQGYDPDYKVKLGSNEKVTTTGGDAKSANAGAPTTNKVNGTGASSKAAMRPSVGLNAEFKGASVPSAPDLVAAKKARQVAQTDATMPDAVTVTPKETNSKPRKTRAPKGEKELSKRQIRRQERKENTVVSTDKLGSKSASIPTPESNGASKLAPISAPKPSAGSNFAGTGMSKSEVSDLSEALTDRKNANVRGANKSTAASIQANTGTADRASYNRTSADIDGTPTREDSDRSIISAAQMRYESNVGIKKSTPMKKGYFKGK